jgi:hypothetical protein
MHDGKKCHCKARLSVCGFSIASAIVSGLAVYILGLMAMHLGIGAPYVVLLGSVYKGYAATYVGSGIGGLWAMAAGLICGFVFSCIYNLCARCCCHRCKCCKKEVILHKE